MSHLCVKNENQYMRKSRKIYIYMCIYIYTYSVAIIIQWAWRKSITFDLI